MEELKALDRLRELLGELAPVLVAFSGGVDSTLVLKVALQAAGVDGVVAVTAHGPVHTTSELEIAHTTVSLLGARHVVILTDELALPGFAANRPDRCFLCRRSLFERLLEMARLEGLQTVVDGSNRDDLDDFRPGLAAARALGVRSPLAELGLGKQEVRALARRLGLSGWDRPSSPCLASRFPYGEPITTSGLGMVEEGERYLGELGFRQVRVRHHGHLARLEVAREEIARVTAEPTRHDIVRRFRELGYIHVALDLEGYRSGSLNEVLAGGHLKVKR